MAFPLIPVLVGAAAVGAVTYFIITRNPNAKKQLTNAAQDLGDSVQAGAEKLTEIVSDTVDDAGKAVSDTVDDAGKAAKDVASNVKDAASKVIN